MDANTADSNIQLNSGVPIISPATGFVIGSMPAVDVNTMPDTNIASMPNVDIGTQPPTVLADGTVLPVKGVTSNNLPTDIKTTPAIPVFSDGTPIPVKGQTSANLPVDVRTTVVVP